MAQSSLRGGCPSQSTNLNVVSTNQSMIPTPRLPNEIVAYEAVERTYTAMKGEVPDEGYDESPYHLKKPEMDLNTD